MPKVKLRNTPHQTTEVTEQEMTDLRRMGLLIEEPGDEAPAEQDESKDEKAAPKATRPKALISDADQKTK